MSDVQIKIEIQDSGSSVKKRATLSVPEDITQKELLNALTNRYKALVTERSSVLVEWPSSKAATGRLVTDGALVIIRPRSLGVRFLDED